MNEFALIDKLNEILKCEYGPDEIGPGDDAALISGIGPGELLVSKDLLVEGVHFDFNYCTPQDVGWKALAVNESDIFAMGGHPKAAVVGLALPLLKQDLAIGIYQGFRQYLDHSETRIFGGDIVSSDSFCISVTILGSAKKPIRRSGAKIGDDLWISGPLGASFLGLNLLKGKNDLTLDENLKKLCKDLHKRPKAQKKISEYLVALGKTTSMIDVSDGLFKDLGHLADQSRVSFSVVLEDVPTVFDTLDVVKRLELMNGGEDYQLLFTQDKNAEMGEFTKLFPQAKKIGSVVEDGEGPILINSISLESYFSKLGVDCENLGFDHFVRRN